MPVVGGAGGLVWKRAEAFKSRLAVFELDIAPASALEVLAALVARNSDVGLIFKIDLPKDMSLRVRPERHVKITATGSDTIRLGNLATNIFAQHRLSLRLRRVEKAKQLLQVNGF